MINAIVLAAGESKRMGVPKSLLRFPRNMGVPPMSPRGTLSLDQPPKTDPPDNAHGWDADVANDTTTFLEQIVSVLQKAGLDRVTVVLGAQARTIRESTDLTGTDIVINEDYRQGQLSSLAIGLKSLPAGTEAVLLCLVDNPFITVRTVQGVIGAFRVSGRPIVVPVFEGRRGHPTLFARPMFDELLNAPADQGARHVLHANRDRVFEVQVADPGILVRIDTPADYSSYFGIAPEIIER